MFKVAKPVAGASEPPPLPPTTVVADFKRRRKETEAERFAFLKHLELVLQYFDEPIILALLSKHLASRLAKKASKSHKRNLSEFNDLMEKLPVHNEQRKINWYKF